MERMKVGDPRGLSPSSLAVPPFSILRLTTLRSHHLKRPVQLRPPTPTSPALAPLQGGASPGSVHRHSQAERTARTATETSPTQVQKESFFCVCPSQEVGSVVCMLQLRLDASSRSAQP